MDFFTPISKKHFRINGLTKQDSWRASQSSTPDKDGNKKIGTKRHLLYHMNDGKKKWF